MDRALTDLRAGDTLVVWKIDRLGRSLRNLLEIAETLNDRNVALRSLTEHIDRRRQRATCSIRFSAPSRSSSGTFCRRRDTRGSGTRRSCRTTARSPLLKCGRRARCLSAVETPRTWRVLCALRLDDLSGDTDTLI